MSDLISRQAAVDAIYETFCYAYCDNCEKEMNEVLCGDCHRKYQNWAASKKIISKTINSLPSVQPEIIRCKDCKYWMPYDWMFSETWRSQNMDDYLDNEIGCQYCDMSMTADDFCSRAERRTDEPD